jgi:TonB-linked SusC/RagA family outer membrane protein
MKKIAFFLSIMFFMGSLFVHAQTKVITGTVTSVADNQAIPGVSVSIKGTTLGTITNIDGGFELTVPQDAKTLVFSFIGMKNYEVEIGSQTTFNVKMETDVFGIDEVVVTAMGIQRQARELGYAVTKIDSKLVTRAQTVKVTNALAGKVAGLQVNTVNNNIGSDVRIVLRGARSFLGNNQALLVLDGVPTALSYINTINPNDIEDVTVLKGANASALYGSEAANGVISITTKRGEKDKTVVEFSNTTQFENVSFLPEMQTRFGSGSGSDIYGYGTYTPYENQSYGAEFDGSEVELGLPINAEGTIQKVKYSALLDEKENFFETGVTFQNNLSIRSGTDKNQFFLSIQDAKVSGIIMDDTQRRSGLRVAGSKISGKLKAGYNFQYTHYNTSTVNQNVYWEIMNTPMHIPLTTYKDWKNNPFADPNGYFNAYYGNPYWWIGNDRADSKSDWMTGTADLQYEFTPWLKGLVRTTINFSNSTYKNTLHADRYSDWAASLSDRAYSNAGDKPGQSADGSAIGQRWTNEAILTAEKGFGDFNIKLIGGFNSRETFSKNIDISAAALQIDDFYNIKNRIGEPGVGEAYYRTRFLGAFGDLTVGYKEFLFLHATGRNDWTSLLNKGNNSFFYPGADVSFVFTEAFPVLKDYLDFGKLRGGIAQVGTLNVGPYQLQNLFGLASGFPYGTLTSFVVDDTFKNPNLKPEMSISKEIGLELGFLDSRVNLVLGAYQTNTKDQTLTAQISNASGFTGTNINTGELMSKGFEFETRLIPVRLQNGLTVELNINYTLMETEVLEITADQDEILIGGSTTGAGIWAIKGQPYPVLKARGYKRDPSGRVIVDGKTGYPVSDPTPKSFGQTTPKHMLGINTSISYKGINLTAVAEYRGGGVIYNASGWDMSFPGVDALSASAGRQRFVWPNSSIASADGKTFTPNTNVSTATGDVNLWTTIIRGQFQEPWITSSDFWKFRELSISYDLPWDLKKVGVQAATVGFVGRNLKMWLPKSNHWTDPEFANTTGNAMGITDIAQTPPTRNLGFTVNVKF